MDNQQEIASTLNQIAETQRQMAIMLQGRNVKDEFVYGGGKGLGSGDERRRLISSPKVRSYLINHNPLIPNSSVNYGHWINASGINVNHIQFAVKGQGAYEEFPPPFRYVAVLELSNNPIDYPFDPSTNQSDNVIYLPFDLDVVSDRDAIEKVFSVNINELFPICYTSARTTFFLHSTTSPFLRALGDVTFVGNLTFFGE